MSDEVSLVSGKGRRQILDEKRKQALAAKQEKINKRVQSLTREIPDLEKIPAESLQIEMPVNVTIKPLEEYVPEKPSGITFWPAPPPIEPATRVPKQAVLNRPPESGPIPRPVPTKEKQMRELQRHIPAKPKVEPKQHHPVVPAKTAQQQLVQEEVPPPPPLAPLQETHRESEPPPGLWNKPSINPHHRNRKDPELQLAESEAEVSPEAINKAIAVGKQKKDMLYLALVLGLNTLMSTNVDAKPITERLIDRLGHIQSYSAHFNQELKADNGDIISESSGEVAFMRPGRFKWRIKTPDPLLIVADGKKVWHYDESLEQITVQEGAAQDNTAATLLTGNMKDILALFRVKACDQLFKVPCFQLHPVDTESNLSKVRLYFSDEKLTKMLISDRLSQETELNFDHIKVNPQLNTDIFKFTPPKGVDIIGKH